MMSCNDHLMTLTPQQTENGISASPRHATEPGLSQSEVTKDADGNSVDPIQDEEVLSVVQHVTQHQQVLSIVQEPPRGRELLGSIHISTQDRDILRRYQEQGQDCQQSSHQQNHILLPPMDQGSAQDQDLAVPQEEGHEALLAPCMPNITTTIQGLTFGVTCEDEAWEAGGWAPACVIAQADEVSKETMPDGK